MLTVCSNVIALCTSRLLKGRQFRIPTFCCKIKEYWWDARDAASSNRQQKSDDPQSVCTLARLGETPHGQIAQICHLVPIK